MAEPGLRESYLFDRNTIAEIQRAAREGIVRVAASAEAGEFVRGRGGKLRGGCGHPGATATASISTS